VYSTYLGGSNDDSSRSIVVDGSGSAYVTGRTYSTDFPTVNAFQGTNHGDADIFVSEFSPSGTSLIYSTYLGGRSADSDRYGRSIAVDGDGNAYVTGETVSTDFPMANALQGTSRGNSEAFVSKLGPSGDALVYSTYLGGSGSDKGINIAVDGSGSAY